MKKIYQKPSILALEIEIGDMLCQSPVTGSTDSGSGSDEGESGMDGGVKSNSYHNPVQWEDWQ